MVYKTGCKSTPMYRLTYNANRGFSAACEITAELALWKNVREAGNDSGRIFGRNSSDGDDS